jgi:hypothetical protein
MNTEDQPSTPEAPQVPTPDPAPAPPVELSPPPTDFGQQDIMGGERPTDFGQQDFVKGITLGDAETRNRENHEK